jgi:hypothetical protein
VEVEGARESTGLGDCRVSEKTKTAVTCIAEVKDRRFPGDKAKPRPCAKSAASYILWGKLTSIQADLCDFHRDLYTRTTDYRIEKVNQ